MSDEDWEDWDDVTSMNLKKEEDNFIDNSTGKFIDEFRLYGSMISLNVQISLMIMKFNALKKNYGISRRI
jgi:hypothetical protein